MLWLAIAIRDGWVEARIAMAKCENLETAIKAISAITRSTWMQIANLN